MAGALPVGTVLAVAGDGAVDQVGLAVAEFPIAQAQSIHDPRPEAFHDAVGGLQ